MAPARGAVHVRLSFPIVFFNVHFQKSSKTGYCLPRPSTMGANGTLFPTNINASDYGVQSSQDRLSIWHTQSWRFSVSQTRHRPSRLGIKLWTFVPWDTVEISFKHWCCRIYGWHVAPLTQWTSRPCGGRLAYTKVCRKLLRVDHA